MAQSLERTSGLFQLDSALNGQLGCQPSDFFGNQTKTNFGRKLASEKAVRRDRSS
jgi:hypothetical protein